MLPPKLAADVTLMSGLAGRLEDAVLLSVGCVLFEFLLPLLTAASVVGAGAEVLVSAGAMLGVPLRAHKVGH